MIASEGDFKNNPHINQKLKWEGGLCVNTMKQCYHPNIDIKGFAHKSKIKNKSSYKFPKGKWGISKSPP